ncbi:MAG: MaoC/PaaZ C-terminal domain-containing protein [Pseudomonadota bacterium]
MGLNLDIIGERIDAGSMDYGTDQVILYALGIGAEVAGELDFLYEKNMKVFPTFAVYPFVPSLMPLAARSGINLPKVLHGEHKIVLHGPIPPRGRFITTAVCQSMYDKGDKGGIVNWVFETRDETGRLLFENYAAVIDRSAGNFGGDRGPKSEKLDPPEGQAPDFEVDYLTSPDQAALYRLSGDKNPLHIEKEFAARGGLPRPILHGLCTFGYAGRAVLHQVGGGDPSRLRTLAGRFLGVVFPGEKLTVQGWSRGEGKYLVRTFAGEGRPVLAAMAELV